MKKILLLTTLFIFSYKINGQTYESQVTQVMKNTLSLNFVIEIDKKDSVINFKNLSVKNHSKSYKITKIEENIYTVNDSGTIHSIEILKLKGNIKNYKYNYKIFFNLNKNENTQMIYYCNKQ